MDSLSQINTVQDLLAIQNKKVGIIIPPDEEGEDDTSEKLIIQGGNKTHPFVQDVMDRIYDEDPVVGQELAAVLIVGLKDLHEVVAQNKVDEGKAEEAAIWASDHIKLSIILDLLSQIALWKPLCYASLHKEHNMLH